MTGTCRVMLSAMLAASGCGRLGFDTTTGAVGGDGGPGGDANVSLPDAEELSTMTLVHKTDGPAWTPLTGPTLGLPYGVLTWAPRGPRFRFRAEAAGLVPGTNYTLVQFIDPYPGDPAADLAAATVDAQGVLVIPETSYELDRDLTTTTGKVWLVPTALLDTNTKTFASWDVTAILFELDFVVYDDTDVP